MALRKRVAKAQTIPAEPILPSISVQRVGLTRYKIELDTAKKSQSPTWFYDDFGYITAFGNYRGTVWYATGTEKHAQAKAQRILNRYMRRLGYTTGEATRFVAKDLA